MSIAYYDSRDLARRLPFRRLIDGLARSYEDPVSIQPRQRLEVSRGREFLVMPIAVEGHAGAKLITIVPENSIEGDPVIQGLYALFDLGNGKPIAIMDAAELTSRRTAAISALAADRLATTDARRLLLVGSGNLIPYYAEAMMTIRGFDRIELWARNPVKAEAAIVRIRSRIEHSAVNVAGNLEDASRNADVICCLTSATAPLICGDWLKQGAHLDCAGGYRPDMREADDTAFARARIFVDDRAAALSDAGDILHPISTGAITPSSICGDILDLACGSTRQSADEITLFKSVGTAVADLYSARIALEG